MSQSASQSSDQNTVHYVNHYLEKTLGVSQILNQLSSVMHESDLGFFFEDYDQYSEAEKQLTNKIIQALKLDSQKYSIYDLNQKDQINIRLKIYFCHNPSQMDETYSPRRLLEKPELKKIVWAFLQKQMLNF